MSSMNLGFTMAASVPFRDRPTVESVLGRVNQVASARPNAKLLKWPGTLGADLDRTAMVSWSGAIYRPAKDSQF
jgi:hypothetical protein